MARSINALILDDSVMTRKMIMKDLSATGMADFDFTEADDGQDGLEKFQPEEMDIIFCDMQMPRMDGVEFLLALREKHPTTPPAIMITSERSMEVLEKAAEAGFAAFMLKPVDKDRLQKGLRKLIDSLPEKNGHGKSKVPHGECVSEGFQEILEGACGLKLSAESENEAVRRGAIVFGTIGIVGGIHWSVGMGFQQETAAAIASKFAGFDIPFDSPDMGDAISELVNVVAGEIKRKLSEREIDVEISLPVVNAAENIRTIAQRSTTTEHRHFDSGIGKMWTSVTVGVNPGLVL